ncbi:PREDICTED: alpha-1,3-mannosyl-glycoprotein 4-beta-N-acetylglucosaminyltransferase B-like [Fulmarus glacialis]|uniref:alpha-1,3-mannosyl-glycoprotein 4-beta-N-acetylglucosaminyltransferase B-like n=1 Tax=Fulmarus glacialis TaxID=30455 RepID=UPI00051B258A|nr:PREDICTED: alpha-1,3-mannosyl-glycoprotein 4-beta-N-acetylglucosaminyltransferase B-like [Fulmarus glacialis]
MEAGRRTEIPAAAPPLLDFPVDFPTGAREGKLTEILTLSKQLRVSLSDHTLYLTGGSTRHPFVALMSHPLVMDCEKEKAKLRIRAKPSLFQHVGIYSSLAGKIQNLKDKDFGKNVLHRAHNNPPAKVDTSLRTYQQYTLEKFYTGKDCFWASAPVAGDYIRFTFLNPLKVEKYLFRSGNMEHPGDKLFNTTVEVLPADEMLRKELVDNGSKFNYPATKDGYLKIGAFENGIAEGSINQSIGKIQAIRLSVNSDSPVWAILSEVLIKTSEN